MDNLLGYADGFVSGAIQAQPDFMNKIGNLVNDGASIYIDAMAKANPNSLHHVYEWYETGQKSSRLFEIKHRVTARGVTFSYNFKQSTSIKNGSTKAFRKKAQIMENGTDVTIAPKNAMALYFDIDGAEVFSKRPITVKNPGGDVDGNFANTLDEFFSKYYVQSFLTASGIFRELETPTEFKRNISKGVARGKSAGISAGKQWLTSINMEVE